MSEVTNLIVAVGHGDSEAAGRLFPIVYEELRRIARSHMANERAGHTLQPTALVHEAYFRLIGDAQPKWDGRGHFFAAAAEAMRRILIDHARTKLAAKRGGAIERVPVDDFPEIELPCRDVHELLALDEALDALAASDPEKAKLVALLYFAGLSLEEAGEVLGISRTTAYRQWQFARAWLRCEMGGGEAR